MKTEQMKTIYHHAMEQLPLDGLEGRTLEKLSSAKDKKRGFPAKRIAAAAGAVMLLCATGALILSHTTQIELTNTQGRVSAHYTPFFPKEVNRANCLVNRTEEELFHTKNLAPFLGTVERIRNIRVDLNGAVSYRAIADVSVNKAYLGNVEPGSTVSILLPCSIGRGEWATGSELAASLREGTTGIFMPIAYTVDSYWEENGARIDLSELAPYGLMDGERYLFLQGKDGKMQFAQYAYPSLQADASLGDIEAFAKSFWK